MITNVLEYLENSAARFPDKVALSDENGSVTYAQYAGMARRIGSFLAKRLDGRMNCPVAVLIDRSIFPVIAFMGVVYSGNFYVPIDPSMPEERVKLIFDTLQPVLVLDATADEPSEDDDTVFFEVAVSEPEDEALLGDIRSRAIDLDPLYTLFTSGSTGVPKGASITHRGVIDLVEAFDKVFDFDADCVFGNQAPFDFDVSTKDIYDAMKHGGRVEVIPKKLFMLPKPLLQYLCERDVNVLIWSVSALRIIADFKAMDAKAPKTADGAAVPPEAPSLPQLRYVMLCGEMMPVKALNYWRTHLPQTKYVNLYGPTEITCNCVFHEITEDLGDSDLIPIGRPFPNSRVLLLDDERKTEITRAEVGKIGEICVGGSCLALGYWNNPERTEGAFIQNPFVSEYKSTLYATGDMAYYNENGDLVFAARRDFQIKHMGHRIELGEVEAALNAIEGIDVACCLYNQPEKKIYCFYQSAEEDTKKIATELLKKLPKYMCPNVYVRYDRLPLNKNSKIDRVRLRTEHFGE